MLKSKLCSTLIKNIISWASSTCFSNIYQTDLINLIDKPSNVFPRDEWDKERMGSGLPWLWWKPCYAICLAWEGGSVCRDSSLGLKPGFLQCPGEQVFRARYNMVCGWNYCAIFCVLLSCNIAGNTVQRQGSLW